MIVASELVIKQITLKTIMSGSNVIIMGHANIKQPISHHFFKLIVGATNLFTLLLSLAHQVTNFS
jgi:hypothetical protein